MHHEIMVVEPTQTQTTLSFLQHCIKRQINNPSPPINACVKSPSTDVTVTPIPPSLAVTSICISSLPSFFFLPLGATSSDVLFTYWPFVFVLSADPSSRAGVSSLAKEKNAPSIDDWWKESCHKEI